MEKETFEIEESTYQDKIRGSLIAGAAGDALGYAIEFYNENTIYAKYGNQGITHFELDRHLGKAIISDDTQMTLFTANGLLVGDTFTKTKGAKDQPHTYLKNAYHDWLLTQESSMSNVNKSERNTQNGGYSWLLDVPELYNRRAPGNTCLSALRQAKEVEDYIDNPVNNSKGCGGIMRVAPLALLYNNKNRYNHNDTDYFDYLDKEGAYVAAITHGHPLGYMPAAVVTHIINRLVYGECSPLEDIVTNAKEAVSRIFAGFGYLDELEHLIDLAIELSKNDDTDLNNIHKLGEGWVAEETLAIALYCALKYQNDISKALIVSVNHNGDSDSTGAVTGNILGALVGYDAIDERWKNNLELHDIIIEIADDLCQGCQMNEAGDFYDQEWVEKYMYMHRVVK